MVTAFSSPLRTGFATQQGTPVMIPPKGGDNGVVPLLLSRFIAVRLTLKTLFRIRANPVRRVNRRRSPW